MATVLSSPESIQYMHLASLKGAVKLEALGMKRSRHPSATSIACSILGLPKNTDREVLLAKLELRMAELLSEARNG